MFELRDIRQGYDRRVVLELARFAGDPGESWLVLGPSGSGKTTLLHLMAGLMRPDRGTVSVAGQDLSRLGGAGLDRFRGASIGIVFQQLHLLDTLTVEENLLLANYLAGRPRDTGHVGHVLSSLGIVDRRRAYPEELSQGQRQRAAIARAIINRPRLILADEPTSALDDEQASIVARLLLDQAANHDASLVVATHDARIAPEFDRTLRLGKLDEAPA